MNWSTAVIVQYFFTHQALNPGSGYWDLSSPVSLNLPSQWLPWQKLQSSGVLLMMAVGATMMPVVMSLFQDAIRP